MAETGDEDETSPEREVVRLRAQKHTFRQIADKLGLSVSRVHALNERAVRRCVEPSVRAIRLEMLEQLDELEQAALKVLATTHFVVSQGHLVSPVLGREPDTLDDGSENPKAGELIFGDPLIDDGPVLAAIDRLVKIQERRARLVGADAATKVEARVEIDPSSIELVKLIRQREERNAVERADLVRQTGEVPDDARDLAHAAPIDGME